MDDTNEKVLEDVENLDDFLEESEEEIVDKSEVKMEMEYDCISQIKTVLEKQEEIISCLANLEEIFQARILHTNFEEKVIDNMHQELQTYKDDLYSKLVLPILKDIIGIRESMLQSIAMIQQKSENTESVPLKTFELYSIDLMDLLERNDIENFSGEVCDLFDATRQRAIKKVKTADETLHGKTERIYSSGYMYNKKVISPEQVSVYIYDQTIQQSEVNTNE